MPNNSNKTALVTGATSGLGFEAAAQLAESGYGKVILACRTLDKAQGARAALIERCGNDVFDTLAIDTSETKPAVAAADEVGNKGLKIDVLLLNAGMGATSLRTNGECGTLLATRIYYSPNLAASV